MLDVLLRWYLFRAQVTAPPPPTTPYITLAILAVAAILSSPR
jgi:hypothetical protein